MKIIVTTITSVTLLLSAPFALAGATSTRPTKPATPRKMDPRLREQLQNGGAQGGAVTTTAPSNAGRTAAKGSSSSAAKSGEEQAITRPGAASPLERVLAPVNGKSGDAPGGELGATCSSEEFERKYTNLGFLNPNFMTTCGQKAELAGRPLKNLKSILLQTTSNLTPRLQTMSIREMTRDEVATVTKAMEAAAMNVLGANDRCEAAELLAALEKCDIPSDQILSVLKEHLLSCRI